MKILFVTNSRVDEHATMRRAFGMAPYLIRLGHSVSVLLEDIDCNHYFADKIPNLNCYYYNSGSLLSVRLQKKRILDNVCFDVIHFCGLGWRNYIFPSNSNVLCLMDHVELESSIKTFGHTRRLAQSLLETMSLIQYSGSIVASRYLYDLFSERLSSFGLNRPILYLPYAYDSNDMKFELYEVELLRNKIYEKSIIVYLGGIHENYCCFEMLEAFRLLAEKKVPFVALMLGNGEGLEHMSCLVEKYTLQDYVYLKGYVPEEQVSAYLYSADVLLSPLNNTITDRARCPSKMLRYISTKKPIVTCAVGEALEYLGDSGFYYEPNSPSSMANTIEHAFVASSDFVPNYDPSQHTWQRRVESWLQWIYYQRPNLN
jgi:glycosyltransferase involved in cell wall biosynthesis